VAYFGLKDLARAEASAKQAIGLAPQDGDPYTLLADIHYAQGSAEEAEADLKAAISRNPRNAGNYLALEALYEKAGRWEQAKKLCETAHAIDPNSPVVANNLAYLYLEHGGEPAIALSLAQSARQQAPGDVRISDTLGWAYYKIGSPQAAISQLEQCVRTAPNNPLYGYHLGMAYMAARRLDAAQRSLEAALKQNPDPALAANLRLALDKLSAL
jgi:tetratricopeptide (TPR) repeat protein